MSLILSFYSLRSCLAVLGASLALFCSVGFLNAYGVFQEYYKEHILQNESDSTLSWIGSVSIFLLYGMAPLAGILVDRVGPTVRARSKPPPQPDNPAFSLLCSLQKLLFFGGVGQLVAVFMTSLCYKYWQFFLAQALLLGASMSFVTWPPVAVVSRCLPHNRGLALGLVIGGSSVGGVVWPAMLERLLNYDNLSFGWVMRVVGFTMLPLLAFACVTVREPPSVAPPPPASLEDSGSDRSAGQGEVLQKKLDVSILRNKVFILLATGLAIGYFGLFVPFFYVSSYAVAKEIWPPQQSFYLISIMNGSSLLGRVIPGHLADRYGHFNIFALANITSAIIAFCWPACSNLAGLICWSVAYGFSSGVSLHLDGFLLGSGRLTSYRRS